jgi:hypothetical protein
MARRLTEEKTRKRKVLTLAGAVFALALVIAIGSSLSSPKPADAPLPRQEVEAGERANKLALEAEQALSRDETSTALMLAEQSLALDPTNPTATRIAGIVRQQASSGGSSGGQTTAPGDTSGNGTPGGGGKTPGDDDGSTKPPSGAKDLYDSTVSDATKLVPSAFRGWEQGRVVAVGTDTQVTFEPSLRADDSRLVVRGLVYARDAGSKADAARFVADVSPQAYPQGGKTLAVGEGFSGYSGSLERQVCVSFARGRYAFEAIITIQPGASVSDAYALALELANSIPAAAK